MTAGSGRHGARREAPPAVDARYRRGAEVLERILPGQPAHLAESLAAVAPDMARLVVEFPIGDIYARPGLDLKSRQLATVAMLAALGSAQPQLAVHLRGARRLGWTRAELVEVLMQVAVYAGFPAALNAIATARQVFGEEAEGAGS